MKTFLYTAIHLPSKQVFARSSWHTTSTEFLQHIIKWNTEAPNVWAYAPTGIAE